MGRFTWGIDGLGRIGLCERGGSWCIFDMLPGWGGHVGVAMLEAQDVDGKTEYMKEPLAG